MVDPATLDALDALIWLRTGQAAAQRLACRQSTVSRRVRHALKVFGLELERHEGEWRTLGDPTLLRMERRVHLQARWQQHTSLLRLEATYWSGPLLATPAPRGWLLGDANIVGVARHLELLRDGIIDAWLAGLPDVPGPDDPELCTIPLAWMPVWFVVATDHPLRQLACPTWEDVAAFPSLALPAGAYPQVEQQLRRLGLWNTPSRMARYDRALWEGRSEQELLVGYGTALSLELNPTLQPLPLALPFSSGEALVVRRAQAQHPRLACLRRTLRRRLLPYAQRHQAITLAPDPAP